MLAGCGVDEQVLERDLLYIAPLENQSADSGLDWMSPLGPAALGYDLAAEKNLAIVRERFSAAKSLDGYFVQSGDRIAVHLAYRDLFRVRTLKMIIREGPASAGLVPLLDQAAKDLVPSARAFPSHDSAAIRSYGEGLVSAELPARARLLETASTQDPKFTAAWIALADARFALHDLPSLAQVASAGLRASSDPLDKALFADYAAIAAQDRAAREKSLAELAKLQPANLDNLRALGELHTQQRKFAQAVEDYEGLIRMEPGDPNSYNFLGYVYAYQGDLVTARKSLERYQELVPGEVNPLDSLGEAHFMLGNFLAAERYFRQAHQLNPTWSGANELLKVAQSRLMTGDLDGADVVFTEALARQKGAPQPIRDLDQARWEFLTGRRKQAIERAQALPPQLAAGQLTIWRWQTGTGPAPANLSNPGVAALAEGRFADAVAPLEKAWRDANPSDDGELRTLLAWAYSRAGRTAEAKTLLKTIPFPLQPGTLLYSLAFPRYLKLKAELDPAEGSRFEQLYQKYSGDLPDKF